MGTLMNTTGVDEVVKHFHLFCGKAGGAIGFNNADARVGKLRAKMVCLGGVDSDPLAIEDFTRFAGVDGTVLDLFDREQYEAWHGHPPPADWREATADDIRKAAQNQRPDIVFTSPPCKGFSGLTKEGTAKSQQYTALNRLTIRGFRLVLRAWRNDPVPLLIMENVPRIAKRGRAFLDVITSMLERAGYVVNTTVHDAGVIGNLGQTRKRFLLVARHKARVPPFLYEPLSGRLRTIGDVLKDMPLPETEGWGRIHQLPRLQWRTWVRLALVEAGKDWRSIQGLRVKDGMLQDYVLEEQARLIGMADPRTPEWTSERTGRISAYRQYGVRHWDETSGTVTGQAAVGSGSYSIADPRLDSDVSDRRHRRFCNVFRVRAWSEHSGTVTGGTGPTSGGQTVADPRTPGGHPAAAPGGRGGPVAGPLHPPRFRPDPVPRIVSIDGTWHRPFTTLELAALQGFPWELMGGGLAGNSDAKWRERIGNAVPPPAAEAIASTMAETLLLARAGRTFTLSARPIWVQPIAAAVSMPSPSAIVTEPLPSEPLAWH